MRQNEWMKSLTFCQILGMWLCLLLILPQQGWAAGTLSGTPISNTATLTYDISGSPEVAVVSSVAFLVDEKINLTVVGGITTSVAPNSTAQATPFTVTNNSNSALDFALSVTTLIGGDDFDPNTCNAYVESGATVGYQASQDIATFIDELAPDATKTVYVVCNIPTAADTNTGLVGLTATARGDFTGPNSTYAPTTAPAALGAVILQPVVPDAPGSVNIVFADVNGPDDAARDAKHSAHNTYLVSFPALTVTKTASVLDPNGGSVVMPGSVIAYQIAVALNGAGTASNLVIDDPLPADTSYIANSITITCNTGTYTGGGACGIGTIATPQPAAPKTDTNADGDFADFTANTITVSLGNVAAPANFVIKFQATIN